MSGHTTHTAHSGEPMWCERRPVEALRLMTLQAYQTAALPASAGSLEYLLRLHGLMVPSVGGNCQGLLHLGYLPIRHRSINVLGAPPSKLGAACAKFAVSLRPPFVL